DRAGQRPDDGPLDHGGERPRRRVLRRTDDERDRAALLLGLPAGRGEHALREVERRHVMAELRGEEGERAGARAGVQDPGRRRGQRTFEGGSPGGGLDRIAERVTGGAVVVAGVVVPPRADVVAELVRHRDRQKRAAASRRRYSGTSGCSSPSTANAVIIAARAPSRSSSSEAA